MALFIFLIKVILGCAALSIAVPVMYWSWVAYHQRKETLDHHNRIKASRYLMVQWEDLLTHPTSTSFSTEEPGTLPGIAD